MYKSVLRVCFDIASVMRNEIVFRARKIAGFYYNANVWKVVNWSIDGLHEKKKSPRNNIRRYVRLSKKSCRRITHQHACHDGAV